MSDSNSRALDEIRSLHAEIDRQQRENAGLREELSEMVRIFGDKYSRVAQARAALAQGAKE